MRIQDRCSLEVTGSPVSSRLTGPLFFGLLALFLAGGSGCSGGEDVTPTPPGSPTPTETQQIQVSATSLELGSVAQGDSKTEQLEVWNQGETTLLLTVTLPVNPAAQFGVGVSGGSVPDALEPGQHILLSVVFTPSTVGAVPGTLRVDSTDPVAPRIDIPLTAVGLQGADGDGDGYSVAAGDCDDGDPDRYPGADELCDGADNDCDEQLDEDAQSTFYQDQDKDGYGDDEASATGCSAPKGYVDLGGDCAPLDASIYPGALEVCDGIDNDCEGGADDGVELTFYADSDQDGHGNSSTALAGCETPTGYVESSDDCNDADSSSYPGAEELCDGLDNDCDSDVDEGLAQMVYRDSDQDGYGDALNSASLCSASQGYVTNSDDCNDTDGAIYPGAEEICDSKDNDCDGSTDENGESTFYLDYDKDGHGDAAVSVQGCNSPGGFVPVGDDCDDRNATIYPGAEELCNNKDDDCDTLVDEGLVAIWYLDADQDGYGNSAVSQQTCNKPTSYAPQGGDCNDLDPRSYPGASELCDGQDNDCDTQPDEGVQLTFYADTDEDGYGDPGSTVAACSAPAGYVAKNTDCDDTRSDVNPLALERCDEVDNDCDLAIDEGVKTTFYRDSDLDGYGTSAATIQSCSAPEGYVSGSSDCNDADPTVHPGATELCDGKDNNCSGGIDEGVLKTYYADSDGDGFGDPTSSSQACFASEGLVTDQTDCNDGNLSIHPGATELCDSLDNDCDSLVDEPGDAAQVAWYLDQDHDGYGVTSVVKYACTQPSGYSEEPDDCYDADPASYPGATELCEGDDNDCDGVQSPQPPPVAGNDGPVCNGASLSLTASTIAGASYAWTGPSGFTSSQQNPTRSGMSPASAGVYQVRATLQGCATDPASTTVVVNAPTAAFDFLPATPQKDQAVTFSPALTSASSYAWTFQNGSPASSTAMNPTVTWSSGGNFAVALTVVSQGCSATSTGVVTVVASYPSCKALKSANSSAPSGTYEMDPDGQGGNPPFNVYCDMTTQGGGWSRCLQFTNTSAEDLANNSWFDTCVSYDNATWTGGEVMVKLVSSAGATSYSAYGSHNNAWTNDQITSTTSNVNQYYSASHNYMIALNNGDNLMISGRNSSNSGCGGSMGNGYGIVVYPTSPNYYYNPKIFVFPYRFQYSSVGTIRSFTSWTPSTEISYNNGSTFNSCDGIPSAAGYMGNFEFFLR